MATVRKKIVTPNAPAPGGVYSQGVKVGNRIYVSGQGPVDPGTGVVVPGGIEEQTRQVMRNISAILEADGASMGNVVKVTAHLSDLRNFELFNKVYREFFEEPYPARTTVGSSLLDILVEVDVVAEY